MKLYDVNDMAKIGCQDCVGCFACCQGMGDTIVLDPWDVYQLTSNLKGNFEQLLSTCVSLHVEDGLLMPHMKMTEKDACFFLNHEGRCNIHSFRPGLCRAFPLGRNYEEGKMSYFIVEGECPRENRTKVKIDKWIGIPSVKKYQEFLTDWHYIKKQLQEILLVLSQKQDSDDKVKTLNMIFLQLFYLQEYQNDQDFFAQYRTRREQMETYIAEYK